MLELLTADYTFLNERLARHYGIPGVSGDAFRRVSLDGPGAMRRGILGHGSVLTLTSVADRTSPVLRGKWVMEVLLGSPPPPPPPNVPDLAEVGAAHDGRLLSVRQRMEQHRASPACSSCHRVIDPLGLALENFDVTGRYRMKDSDQPVDAAGELFDGTAINGPTGLRDVLLKRQETVLRTFSEFLMTYALGRRVEAFDMPTVRAIVRDAGKAGLQDVRLYHERHRQPRVSAADHRSNGDNRPAVVAPRFVHVARGLSPAFDPGERRRCSSQRSICLAEWCCAVWASRLRCRCSTRWCRRARHGHEPPRRQRHGSSASKWCMAPPAQQCSGERSTCGRRWPAAVASISSPTAMSPLEPYREHLTIISNTDVRMAEAFGLPEIGGDHFRSSAVFLTQAHPKQTQGSDVFVGPSMDQIYAQRMGQDTPIPSMQLCIENIDQSGGCAYGYTCVYTDTVSWASATEPLPMVRDPRAAFDQLFGFGSTPDERAAERSADRSVLDWMATQVASIRQTLGPSDRARLNEYLDDVREIERRIQRIEAHNRSGEARELPEAPAGVPDDFEEHVRLMFDLQAIALASEITRVFSFKMSRDSSGRVYPKSGVNASFHPASHHQEREDRILQFNAINKYHVSLMPYFLDKLKATPDGDGSLLDHSLVIYGSPMGNPNVHNHKRCPLFLAGHASGELKGNLHINTPDGTPMANAMLSMMHMLGLDEEKNLGDSTGTLDLNSAT